MHVFCGADVQQAGKELLASSDNNNLVLRHEIWSGWGRAVRALNDSRSQTLEAGLNFLDMSAFFKTSEEVA